MAEQIHPLSGAGESVKKLSEFAEGVPVSMDTLRRWILVGIMGPTHRVFLEAEKHGGEWCTSAEAYRRFHERIAK